MLTDTEKILIELLEIIRGEVVDGLYRLKHETDSAYLKEAVGNILNAVNGYAEDGIKELEQAPTPLEDLEAKVAAEHGED